MAYLHNNQPILGVAEVDETTTIYNDLPVIGVRATTAEFEDNEVVLGVWVLTGGETMFNGARVAGVVFIEDGRNMFNNSAVIPVLVIE